jgi:hypothetical protein
MKVWLDPVEMAKSTGFRRSEINGIIVMVATHRDRVLESWHEYFG